MKTKFYFYGTLFLLLITSYTFGQDTNPANAGEDQFICDTSTTLNGNDPLLGIGNWEIISGQADIADTDNPNSLVTNLVAGRAVLVWSIDLEGAVTKDTVVITAYQEASDFSLSSTALCDDFVISTLPYEYGATYTFDTINGAGRPEFLDSVTLAIYDIESHFELRITVDIPLCGPLEEVFEIVNFDIAAQPDAGIDDTLCVGAAVQLDGNTPAGNSETVKWTTNGAGTFDDDESPDAIYTPSTEDARQTISFFYNIDNMNCNATDTVAIYFGAMPTPANAGEDKFVCLTQTQLAADEPTVFEEGLWTILNAIDPNITFLSSPESPNAVINGIPAIGGLELVWTISTKDHICPSSSDTMHVGLKTGISAANAGLDQTVCPDTEISLEANAPFSQNGETASWTTNGDGTFSATNDPEGSYTPGTNDISSGEVTLTWTFVSCTSNSDDVVISIQTGLPDCPDVDAIKDSEVTHLNVYPNPAQGLIHFDSEDSGNFEIVTPEGQAVKSGQVDLGQNVISISALERGLYFLKVVHARTIKTSAIIIN